jgi:hypothetical protein
MAAPRPILDLLDRFTRNRDAYLSPGYNETQLRREFVDPFFESLGWDIQNKQGHAEPYKDVIHEDAVKVGDATKAPDYSFRVGGTRKFFVETKKPSVNIATDVSPAFQLRRYGWSAKLPLSVLTDFEEFAAYDCRLRPAPGDKPAIARVLYIRCEEYADRWDEIAGVFSREAVLTGAFDKFVESKICQWRFKLTSTNNNVGTNELLSLPFRKLDFRITAETLYHDRMVELVHGMLGLCGKAISTKSEYERNALQRQTAAQGHQIDQLVYELYGLTDEEIRIVEETSA